MQRYGSCRCRPAVAVRVRAGRTRARIREASVPAWIRCCRRAWLDSCDPWGRCRCRCVVGGHGQAFHHDWADDVRVAAYFSLLHRRRGVRVLHSYCSRFIATFSPPEGGLDLLPLNNRFLVPSLRAHEYVPKTQCGWNSRVNDLLSVWRLEPGGAEGQLESMAAGNIYDGTARSRQSASPKSCNFAQ